MRYSIKRRNKKAIEHNIFKASVKRCPKCGSDNVGFISNQYLPYTNIRAFCRDCAYTSTTSKVFWGE